MKEYCTNKYKYTYESNFLKLFLFVTLFNKPYKKILKVSLSEF